MMKTSAEYKVNNQTILQEHVDENYQPTQDEIREYAIYIGIDPDKESHLYWLAKEGIKEALPTGWKACQEENGELYYFNFDTGKSSWDHPCDEIYKRRVIEERAKHSSSSSNLLDTNPRGTFNQTGKSTSTVGDYLWGGKKPFTMGNSQRATLKGHVAGASNFDSQYVNSDNEDFEEELMHSDDDDEEQSGDDFRKNIDFGIDRTLSARIERDEKENMTTPAHTVSRSLNYTENSEKLLETRKDSGDDDDDHEGENERIKRAKLAAQAAERRLSNVNTSNYSTAIHQDIPLVTPREEHDLTKLRMRLDQSLNDEKLQIMEDNKVAIEKLKVDLRQAKEREERTLREKMKADIAAMETELRENLAREKRALENRQQEELNKIKQTSEREKEEYQRQLRASVESDISVFESAVEQQASSSEQQRALQEKLARTEREFDERLRNAQDQHQQEMNDGKRRYEQVKLEREKLERLLKEKDDFCATLQRTIDHLRSDKEATERKLHDAEIQLRSVDDNHRQEQLSLARKSRMTAVDRENDDDDDDDDDGEFSAARRILGGLKNGYNDEEDVDRLSDTDSDVLEMEQTLKKLRQTQLEYMSLLPTSNMNERQKKTATVDLTKLSVADVGPMVRSLRTPKRNIPAADDSMLGTSSQPLNDTGQWSNTMMSTRTSNANPLLQYQMSNRYQPTLASNHRWGSQSSLVTREAVIKAARKVFAPAVIDQLAHNARPSTY